MPILSGCCFCFDLRVGTKIIGVLNLIGALLNSLSFAILLVMLIFVDAGIDTVHKNINEQPPPHETEDEEYIDVLQQQGKSMLELVMEHIDMMKIVLYILLAMSLLMIITSSMLIHGVRRNRQKLLLPFIVQMAINLVIYIALTILILVLFGGQKEVISSVISVVVGVVVNLYFLLVVISQYQALGLIRMHEEISMK